MLFLAPSEDFVSLMAFIELILIMEVLVVVVVVSVPLFLLVLHMVLARLLQGMIIWHLRGLHRYHQTMQD